MKKFLTLALTLFLCLALTIPAFAAETTGKASLDGGTVAVIVVVVVALIFLISCIKIVPQAHGFVIERLGAYKCTWSTGLHFKTPLIDRVAKNVLLMEQVADFPPQAVITKDNV